MAIVINQESEESKEKARWEMHPTIYGAPGRTYGQRSKLTVRRPDGSIEERDVLVGDVWPRMMYKARRTRDGILVCVDNSSPEAENWSRQNYQVCQTEQQHSGMLERGWRDTQQEAMDLVHAKEEGVSTAAAHRAYEDRNMSDKAKAEIAAVEATTPFHVPSKDESPKKRKSAWATRVEKYGPSGRPAKVT